MGQKVNPKSFRIGVIRGWNSKWFSRRNYVPMLRQDVALRKFLMKRLKEAGISQVDLERGPEKLTINLYVSRPGLVIGRSGAGIEDLKKEINTKILNKKDTAVASSKLDVNINVLEVDNPNLQPQVIVDSMALELEKRVPYRRVMKQALQRIEKAGAKGAKVQVSGRLNGADIARTETLTKGQLPLHTLRANIDYSRGAARTIFGQIGIKVWIYKGEVFNNEGKKKDEPKSGTVVKAKTK